VSFVVLCVQPAPLCLLLPPALLDIKCMMLNVSICLLSSKM
jgi:hypothetical protein